MMMSVKFCVHLSLLVLTLLSLCASDGLPQTERRKPPHIVFIVADDLGWNDVGWHNPQMLTPNLDSLASRGLKLEASYVQPTCTPSRNSFLTGMFPFHTELQRVMDSSEPSFLPLKYPTIAEKLKEQGYSTHIVGKWHLGYCNEKYTPIYRGFDSFLGFYMGSQDHYTRVRAGHVAESISGSTKLSSLGHDLIDSFLGMRTKGLTQGRDFRFNISIWTKTEGVYSTHAFATRAMDIIKRHDPDVPLFLYVPFSAPHSPLQTDGLRKVTANCFPKAITTCRRRDVPLFLYVPFSAPHSPLQVPPQYEQLYSHIKSRERRVYSGMVTALDEAVGRIVLTLQQTQLIDNLLLVFTSDNGGSPYMGGNNLPLRGGKNTLWEGGTRVPTFVYSPTLLQARGRVSNELIHAVDWFPTFLDIAGAPSVAGIDGLSQWQFLQKGTGSARTEFVYNIEPKGKGAIRRGDYKLIVGRPGQYNDWYPVPGSEHVRRNRFKGGKHDNVTLESGPYYLFNVKVDPSEVHNIAIDFPEVVSELSVRFAEWNVSKVVPHSPRRAAQADPILHGGFWSPGWC